MAIITLSGRAGIASLVKNTQLYLAWGTGDVAWDSTPESPSSSDDDLEAELGRRKPSSVAYVTPNVSGEIVLPNGNRYTASVTPTSYVYVRTLFEYDEEPTGVIRESGLWIGTVPDTGHEGDDYLDVGDIDEKGLLFTLDRFPKITRNSGNREIFEFVISI
jgi:hypothetical protein